MLFHALFEMHAKRKLKAYFTSVVIFSFALSLITIFEPIFFYQQGFPIWGIALYYALHYSLYIILLPLGGKLVAFLGLERSIAASLPWIVLYFLTLASIVEYPYMIICALVLLTVHKSLYWPPAYAIFSRSADGGNRGTEISWLNVFRYGSGILGPVSGGFIAGIWGFPTLFFCGAALVLVSGIPLLYISQAYRGTAFSYMGPWKMMRHIEYRKTFLSTLGWGENLIDIIFWPLYLFIILDNVESLGIYLSISLVVMAIGSFFIGDIAERYSKERVLRAYLPFMVLGYALRIFSTGPARVVLIDSLARLSFAGVTIPMMYKMYSQAKRTHSLEFAVAFELVLAISKASLAFAIVALFLFLPVHAAFIGTFILGGLAALLYGLL